MAHKLTGKVALVTGASRGIGAAIAKKLAEEGAHVAISYASSAEKAEAVVKHLEREGIHAKAFKADQSNPVEVENLVHEAVKHFGHLDILVSNAGVFAGGAIDDPELNMLELQRQLATNVWGTVVAVHTATKYMGEGSRIILIGSTRAEFVYRKGIADYSATKAALAAYAKGWARDLGPKNITVNTIQPGAIDTEMNPETSERAQITKTMTALGRYGRPEEIAAAAAFLASPEASYITGTTLNVDGGLNA